MTVVMNMTMIMTMTLAMTMTMIMQLTMTLTMNMTTTLIMITIMTTHYRYCYMSISMSLLPLRSISRLILILRDVNIAIYLLPYSINMSDEHRYCIVPIRSQASTGLRLKKIKISFGG